MLHTAKESAPVSGEDVLVPGPKRTEQDTRCLSNRSLCFLVTSVCWVMPQVPGRHWAVGEAPSCEDSHPEALRQPRTQEGRWATKSHSQALQGPAQPRSPSWYKSFRPLLSREHVQTTAPWPSLSPCRGSCDSNSGRPVTIKTTNSPSGKNDYLTGAHNEQTRSALFPHTHSAGQRGEQSCYCES